MIVAEASAASAGMEDPASVCFFMVVPKSFLCVRSRGDDLDRSEDRVILNMDFCTSVTQKMKNVRSLNRGDKGVDFYWVKRGVMMRGDKDPALLGCRSKHQQLRT